MSYLFLHICLHIFLKFYLYATKSRRSVFQQWICQVPGANPNGKEFKFFLGKRSLRKNSEKELISEFFYFKDFAQLKLSFTSNIVLN